MNTVLKVTELSKDNIQRLLIAADVRQLDIAKECKVSAAAVSMVIGHPGVIRNYSIERVITRITGLDFPAMKRVRRS